MRKYSRTILLLLVVSLLSACQPTPSATIVVNKEGNTIKQAIDASPSASSGAPYSAPERLKMEIGGLPDDYKINIDAEVDVSKQTAWPVYTAEQAKITQGQADAVRNALLGDTVLYKPSKIRSRAEIQKDIDNYEEELKDAAADEECKDLVSSYKDILKKLYAEYAKAPENLVMKKADTDFKFMEDQVQLRPDQYGGKEVKTDDGGIRTEWTDDARKKAIEAGCENIYGVCWTDKNRKMEFSAGNGSSSSFIRYGIADGNIPPDPGVTCTPDEASEKAGALLKKAGLDFTLVSTVTTMNEGYDDKGNYFEKGKLYYSFKYKRVIPGVPQDDIISCIDQSIDKKEYRSQIPAQETISIAIDDYGVREFYWNYPMKITATENANVPLIPFDLISKRIGEQLKIETVWESDNEAKWIDSRRLDIKKVVLSYIMAAKSDDMSSYYLIPVWNVCGDLIYHYKDSYPTGKSDTYVLDKNNERNVWRARDDKGDYSILTINAVDGSVMPRHRWY